MLFNLIRKYWIFLTLFILTAITILSLSPLEKLPPVPSSDKAHHFIAYAALMLPTAIRRSKYGIAIALFFICWSGAIELLQPYVNRYGEWQDLVANIIGLLFGWLLAQLVEKFMPTK